MAAHIPPEESEAYHCIIANKFNLGRFLEQFQISVSLFELLERGGGDSSVGVLGGIFIKYRIIAARDGGLNIYHFGCSLEAIKKQLPTCRTLSKKIDAIKVRNTVKQFAAYFPHCDNVRHAVAHAGEVFSSPESMRGHTQRSDHKGVGFESAAGSIFGEALYERTYSVSNNGQIFSVMLDQASIDKLGHIISLMNDAFEAPDEQTALQVED